MKDKDASLYQSTRGNRDEQFENIIPGVNYNKDEKLPNQGKCFQILSFTFYSTRYYIGMQITVANYLNLFHNWALRNPFLYKIKMTTPKRIAAIPTPTYIGQALLRASAFPTSDE